MGSMPLPCFPMCAAGQGNTTSPVAVPVQYPLNRFPSDPSLIIQSGSPTECHNTTLRRADSKQHRAYETKMRNLQYRWGQFSNQAKQRGLKVGISFEAYQQLIYSACHYCSHTHQARLALELIGSIVAGTMKSRIACRVVQN